MTGYCRPQPRARAAFVTTERPIERLRLLGRVFARRAISAIFANRPHFFGAEIGPGSKRPRRRPAFLSLSFNRRIWIVSVGRFQLALRALDLRAAPCPRGLVRPSGSLAGDPTSWGLTPP